MPHQPRRAHGTTPPGRITNMCLDVDTTADMPGELAVAPAAAVRWRQARHSDRPGAAGRA
jgi:hypothetical protein